VDRLTLVELIQEEKAKLSPEVLRLWEELDASLYKNPEAEPTFIKRREADIITVMEQLPEADQRIVEVLSELRAGLYEFHLSERRRDLSQWHRDRCVISASIIKDRHKRGEGDPLPPSEVSSRTVEQALARLRQDY
jgi:hypothetical protein